MGTFDWTGVNDIGKELPKPGSIIRMTEKEMNEHAERTDQLAADMKERLAYRKSDAFRCRKIFKIPARLIFEALRLQGLLPKDAVYLDAHCDHYEETFAIKVCHEDFPLTREGETCVVEQAGLEVENVEGGLDTLRFHVL